MMKSNKSFAELVNLMQRLRAPNGCPWDRKQTHNSLRPFLLEETHEVLEAIASRSSDKLQDELGDLLFQIIFHAQLAKEAGRFDIYDVIQGSLEKMQRRHPHVFGKTKLRNSKEVLENWEEIKKRERGGKGAAVLEGVPKSLPALIRAHRVQSKASRVGFDYSTMDQAMQHVRTSIDALTTAVLKQKTGPKVLGDALFALVNLARFSGANPEDALHVAVGKFIKQFEKTERKKIR
jgi:tetrapyrrole methylase family protein / MazG family protein